MTPVEISIRLVAGAMLILANGFFVAIEFALTRARQFSEAEFVGEGHSAPERAWEMTDFRGVVYAPILNRHREELADGAVDFEAIAAPPMTLSPDVDVSDAIDQFQAENQELALVIEDGEVVGMVTVTDLLESITGDITDPIDLGESETIARA
jgi:CBS domain containing-hemolysin-like protein